MMCEAEARGVVLREFARPLTLEAAPVPEPGPGALVARVDLAGVCGTDVHLHHGHLPIPLPVILVLRMETCLHPLCHFGIAAGSEM